MRRERSNPRAQVFGSIVGVTSYDHDAALATLELKSEVELNPFLEGGTSLELISPIEALKYAVKVNNRKVYCR
ncbi:MAG: hypothetical protein ACHQ1H_07175 [Nitrososphaerales archaeon]